MIAAAIPSLKPLFRAVLQPLSGGASYTSSRHARVIRQTGPCRIDDVRLPSSSKSYEMYAGRRLKNTTVVVGGTRRENESVESILDVPEGIYVSKTTRVSVSVD